MVILKTDLLLWMLRVHAWFQCMAIQQWRPAGHVWRAYQRWNLLSLLATCWPCVVRMPRCNLLLLHASHRLPLLLARCNSQVATVALALTAALACISQVVLQGFLNVHISTWARRLITRRYDTTLVG